MRPATQPPVPPLTVGALETYLAEHDVPPDAEIRLRRSGETSREDLIADFHVAALTATWDPPKQVLVLAEGDPCSGPRPESSPGPSHGRVCCGDERA
jgi:hypothetical protein